MKLNAKILCGKTVKKVRYSDDFVVCSKIVYETVVKLYLKLADLLKF